MFFLKNVNKTSRVVDAETAVEELGIQTKFLDVEEGDALSLDTQNRTFLERKVT